MEKVNGEINGTETDNPFEVKTDNFTATNRAELEKLTVKEIAQKIKDENKSHLKLTTLTKLSKSEVIDIYLQIGQEEKPKGRTTNSGVTNDILNNVLSVAQGFKIQREGINAQINPIAKDIFLNNGSDKIDNMRKEGNLSNETFKNVLFFGSTFIILIDCFIGFDNIPTFISNIKAKIMKKKEPKENDTK